MTIPISIIPTAAISDGSTDSTDGTTLTSVFIGEDLTGGDMIITGTTRCITAITLRGTGTDGTRRITMDGTDGTDGVPLIITATPDLPEQQTIQPEAGIRPDAVLLAFPAIVALTTVRPALSETVITATDDQATTQTPDSDSAVSVAQTVPVRCHVRLHARSLHRRQ